MKNVFEIIQIKVIKTEFGYTYEVDGRVLEILNLNDMICSPKDTNVKFAIEKIISYGKELNAIYPPMGGKLILSSNEAVNVEKYLVVF